MIISPSENRRISLRFDLTTSEFLKLNAENILSEYYLHYNVLNQDTTLVAVTQQIDKEYPIDVSYSFRLIDGNNRLSILHIERMKENKRIRLYLSTGIVTIELSIAELNRLSIDVKKFIVGVIHSFDKQKIEWNYLAIGKTDDSQLIPYEVKFDRLYTNCHCSNLPCHCAIEQIQEVFEDSIQELFDFEGSKIKVDDDVINHLQDKNNKGEM